MIIDTLKSIFNIKASTHANWFIYYFKRVPLIGKILPDSIYGNIALKKRVTVLTEILNVLAKLLGKAIFVFLLMLLPVLLIVKTPALRFHSFIYIYFMINCIGSLLSSSIFESSRDQYICIRLMRMDAKNYILSTVLVKNLTDIFTFFPAVLLATLWMGGSPLQSVLLIAYIWAFSLIGEAFHLISYSKSGLILCSKPVFGISVGVLCLTAAYVPVLLHVPPALGPVLFHPACVLAALAAGGLCLSILIKSDSYRDIASVTLKAANFTLDAGKAMGEARFADVAVREKEFTHSELKSDKYKNKKGFAYLNAIFFERHRRLLIKPIYIRLAIISVLFLIAVILHLFIPGFMKPLSNPGKILPAFVFIMYFASIGERVCKAMFYNCDISLLRYSFYREKSAILSNFQIRLFRISGLNLIVAAALSAAVVGLVFIFRLNWSAADIVFFVLSILFLSLFFSVHHLFLYYVFQPYTTELGMKNPFYNAINTVVYALCFFCLQIKSAPSYFSLIVLACTLIYIVAALFSVYKYAPKNFRVK